MTHGPSSYGAWAPPTVPSSHPNWRRIYTTGQSTTTAGHLLEPTGSTSNDDFERTCLRSPAKGVVRFEHLVEFEMVTDEPFGFHLL